MYSKDICVGVGAAEVVPCAMVISGARTTLYDTVGKNEQSDWSRDWLRPPPEVRFDNEEKSSAQMKYLSSKCRKRAVESIVV